MALVLVFSVATTEPRVPRTDPPITLAEGRNLTECVSAVPKPGCTTASEPDTHQLAVFGVLVLAVAFISWRVVRSVRRRDGAAPSVGAEARTRI